MNESELNRAARDVIQAGRDGVVPNEFTAERIRRAVTRALEGSAPSVRSRNRSLPILVALGAAGLAGALYAAEVVRSSKSEAPVAKLAPVAPHLPPPAARIVAPAEPATEEPALEVTAPTEPSHGRAGDRASAAPSARSQRLTAEIALLARVNAAVNAGDGARALELLTEYDRTFRPAILGEERAAASVLALCAAGRTADARAAAKRFSTRWQRSPLSARIARSCAGTQ